MILLTVVDDPLLGYVGQLPVNFKDADAWGDDHRQMSGAIEAPVQIMLLEN